MPLPVQFFEENDDPPVRGFLHNPKVATGEALVLAHGAGSNCEAPLLVSLATALSTMGVTTLRIDLPYRQLRPQGPPVPGSAPRDRAGLRTAINALRRLVTGPFYLGGHSYGGRQSTIVAAEDPALAAGLLLLSYPLHPPRKPEELRTSHFPSVHTKALFIHGSRDPFGNPDAMQEAIRLIPAETKLVLVNGTGHDLARRNDLAEAGESIAEAWREFFRA
jgi:predicted alpha/beta-hydrolase family hydrolase